MRFIYIDEAGNTGRRADPDQPIHMVGALIVDETQVRGLEIVLNELGRETANKLTRAGHRSAALDVGPEKFPVQGHEVEFHGAEIYGGRGIAGTGLNPQERIELCGAIVEACKAAGVRYGSAAVDKMKLQGGGHPHLHCFQFMLERVQDYLARENVLGLIVADEHRELEEHLIRDLAFSKDYSTGWGWRPTAIRNIVDTVHFVKSRHNRLVQACDVLTYFRLRGQRIVSRETSRFLAALRSGSPRGTLEQFIEANCRPTDLAVYRLYSEIRSFEEFEKLWPV